MLKNCLTLIALSLCGLCVVADEATPHVSKSPMDPDQIAVYQAFLASYNNGSKARLNLSKRTKVFNLAEEKKDSCLKGIAFDPAGRTDSVIHEFDPQTALPGNVGFVDPEQQRKAVEQNDPGRAIRQGHDVNSAVDAGFAAGLLTLSEVAFDKAHIHAAMGFSFVCGGLCGHGSTIVFEKKDGKWKELKRQCSSWIS